MRILGIVAEYDPFHNGHLFHISEAKKQVSPDLTFIVLSPCIKQRGDLSLLSPTDRARCALEAGADAVFCLPVLWTVRDAEHYALGAVSLLAGLGVTHLAFGAETPDLDLLSSVAGLLESAPPSFCAVLREKMSAGVGYPAAVSFALSAVLPAAGGILDRPNNTLAVCYLRAVLRLGLSLHTVIIRRTGSYHAVRINPEAPSASSLRDSLMRGCYTEVYSAVPDFTAALLRRRYLGRRVPDSRICDALLISRLRSMDENEYRLLPGLSEGMENAIRTVAASVNTRRELIASLAGKRYPAARISRLCACALLGITADQTESALLPDKALLLGLRRKPDMTAFWKTLPIPVVASFTEWKMAAHPADLTAWRLWACCCRLPDTLPFTEKVVTL